MAKRDETQGRLWLLFSKLRRLKMIELPRLDMFGTAYRAANEERIRGAIRRVEEEIERVMRDV